MITGKVLKPRPYWHVDAKWLTGILLLFLLNITFLVFILVQVTAPEQGIALLTMTLASSFSAESGGLDAAGDIEIMRQKIAEAPNGEFQPIPGMQIIVREEDIAGKTPREARLWFFRQWAEPLYYDGAQGLASLTTDPEMGKNISEGVGPANTSQRQESQQTSESACDLRAGVAFIPCLAYFLQLSLRKVGQSGMCYFPGGNSGINFT